MSDALLVKFRDKSTPHGATRQSLKDIADHLGVSETMAIHMAINRMHWDLFTGDVEYDFPSDTDRRHVDRSAQAKDAVVVDDITDHC